MEFLAVIAAEDTAVALATLVATLATLAATLATLIFAYVWRWRDSRILMTITFTVSGGPYDETPDEDKVPWIKFNALNNSPRATIFAAEAYLEADDGRRFPPALLAMPGYGADVLQPGSPAMYSYPMAEVAKFLQAGGEHSGNLVFVVRDGTGELHEQGVQIKDAERWAEGSRGPDPLPVQRPWWRRLTGSR